MGALRCPCCGSDELVWDYSRGDVVCSACGCVVDRIYSEGKLGLDAEEHGVKRGPRAKPVVERRRLRLVLRVIRNTRPGYVVDEEGVRRMLESGGRRHARIYVRADTPARMHALVDGHPCIAAALRIMDEYPRLSARTLRVKLGIAYYVCLASRGSPPSLAEVSRRTGVNAKHFENVLRHLRRTRLIREIIERLSGDEHQYEEEHHKKRADTRALEHG